MARPAIRNPQPTIRNPLRGITALEILAVLLIVVILTSLSLIGYRRYLNASVLAAESRKIRQTFATARSCGITQNDHYRVAFSLDQRAYWIDQTDAAGAVTRPKVTTPEAVHEEVEIASLVIGGTTYANGTRYVRFFPDGRSDNATLHLIRFAANHANAAEYYTVRLYGPTATSNVFERQRR